MIPSITLQPHHDGSELYVPQETMTLGDTVPVRVRVTGDCDQVWVRVVQDGEPVVLQAKPDGARSPSGEAWYAIDLPIHNPVTGYRFLLVGRSGYQWLNGAGVHDRDVPDASDFRLTVFPSAPSWLNQNVVYQIFPDRFAPASVHRDVPLWAQPAAWDDEPLAGGPGVGEQWYGGDLAGITERLDYLRALGVGTLYLTPVFPGQSNHRYDATTFATVDPLLGGDAALAALVNAAHDYGFRVIGDVTTNHTGVGHEWFQAAQDPANSEHSYYRWISSSPGYVSWMGHHSLPKLDYASPDLRARMLTGSDSVIARYLQSPFHLDGWRVDVANMTGRYQDQDLTLELARDMRQTIAAINPEAALIAEHFHDASADLPGDGWHAAMNYSAFTRPVWTWLADPARPVPYVGLPVMTPRRSGRDVVATMRSFDSLLPWQVTRYQWNMLGSHDTARLRTMVGSRQLVEVAVGLLLTYLGTPMIFAGDELGLTGMNGEHGRATMPWTDQSRWDHATWEIFQQLIAVRQSSQALRDGGLRWLHSDDDALVYTRETRNEQVLVCIARAQWSGVQLPESLIMSDPERLYGPDLMRRKNGRRTVFVVPADGPSVGIWRIR